MMYYAVAKGRSPGIYQNWNDCKNQIDKFKGAIYKKFQKEEDAIEFINQSNYTKKEFNPDYYVYTDGACVNNGKKNAKAGIGIYFSLALSN